MQRFWQDDWPAEGPIELFGAEAHHLSQVLRMHPGEIVEVINGRGRIARAQIADITRKQVTLSLLSDGVQSTPHPRLQLITAVPKGERFDWLIEKATELGVHAVQPVVTARSIVDPRDSKLDRLRLVIQAACKQSGRADWMDLRAVQPLAAVLAGVSQTTADPNGGPPQSPRRGFVAAPTAETSWLTALLDVIAHQSASHSATDGSTANAGTRPRLSDVALVIGPEGGLTEAELAACQGAGFRAVGLGGTILRIETAAIAAAAIWSQVASRSVLAVD